MTGWAAHQPPGVLDAEHGGAPVEGVLDFSANLNPFAPWPGIVDAVSAVEVRTYPDPAAAAPRLAAARLWRVRPEQVRFGAGASELLHRVALAWLAPGNVAVVPRPSFAEYARATRIARGRVIEVPPADDEGRLDLDGMIQVGRANRARLAFVGVPNTPTGETPAPAAVRALRAELPGDCLLVVDESFRAFAAGTLAAPPLLGVSSGVVHVRSVTKDCGLAGLRAGYAVGPPELLHLLDRVAVPWVASSTAQAAAAASFSSPAVTYLDGTLARLERERRRVGAALDTLGLGPRPGEANFVCLRPPRAEALAAAVQSRGIRLRRCASLGMPEHLRIGVRTPADNDALLSALEALAWR